jgi:hypothetical protein
MTLPSTPLPLSSASSSQLLSTVVNVDDNAAAVSTGLSNVDNYNMRRLMRTLQNLTNWKKKRFPEEEDERKVWLSLTRYEKLKVFDDIKYVLIRIYYMTMDEDIIDEVDRYMVGPLVFNVLPIIRWFVKWDDEDDDMIVTYKIEYECTIRSGLQFLMDNYDDFPLARDTRETLAQSLLQWRATLDLSEYDERFTKFASDPVYKLNRKRLYNISPRVPPHHWWWKKVSFTNDEKNRDEDVDEKEEEDKEAEDEDDDKKNV